VSKPRWKLLDAIGSDRRIELAAGDYVLSDVDHRPLEHIGWEGEHDGNSIAIRNVRNLSITGPADRSARLIVRPRYVFVLHFQDCQNIELTNLVMGHEPDKGYCTCGVFAATRCTGMTLTRCDLFGCGTEGLTLTDVRRFHFDRSVVRDCSYGIMTLKKCEDLLFTESNFAQNREYYGIAASESSRVAFEGCTLRHNQSGEPLFSLTGCSDFRWHNGTIRGNVAPAMTSPEAPLKITDSDVAENQIEP